MFRNKKSSESSKLNKKLIGIVAGIVIVIIIVGITSYMIIPENTPNQHNLQQLTNATLQKPLNSGKHITVDLNESMHFTVK